jgi:hypothetical protein
MSGKRKSAESKGKGTEPTSVQIGARLESAAPEAQLILLRVFDEVMARTSDQIRARTEDLAGIPLLFGRILFCT